MNSLPAESSEVTVPGNSRKAHFFPEDESTSLCGKWGFQLVGAARDTDTGKASPDDCVACRRKLEASS